MSKDIQELLDTLDLFAIELSDDTSRDAAEIIRVLLKNYEELENMRGCIYHAIKAGDWVVDGACDPTIFLTDYKPRSADEDMF